MSASLLLVRLENPLKTNKTISGKKNLLALHFDNCQEPCYSPYDIRKGECH